MYYNRVMGWYDREILSDRSERHKMCVHQSVQMNYVIIIENEIVYVVIYVYWLPTKSLISNGNYIYIILFKSKLRSN